MIEVSLKRQPAGCIYWPLTVMTLGVFPLLVAMGERHFIRRMDETGLVTRGGRLIAWNEVTSIVQWKGKVEGVELSNEYILKSPKGRASLPTWRTENGAAAKAFLFQHLPSRLFEKGQ